eukprot:36051-Rhodomonas_salina.1
MAWRRGAEGVGRGEEVERRSGRGGSGEKEWVRRKGRGGRGEEGACCVRECVLEGQPYDRKAGGDGGGGWEGGWGGRR